jgi:hypothetical protein
MNKVYYDREVYVLYDDEEDKFLDGQCYTTSKVWDANWWGSRKYAEEERQQCDEPDRFVVKKMKVKFEIMED